VTISRFWRAAAVRPYLFHVALSAGFCLVLCLSCTDDSTTPPAGTPPSCEVVRPIDGSSFNFGDSVVVEVDAVDPDGGPVSVTFSVNGRVKLVDSSPPFMYALRHLAYRIGDHSVEAVATDGDEMEASDTVTMSILSGVTPVYGFEIVNAFPHDAGAFTQGLLFEDGYLYEGTGLYGQSSLRKCELSTGEILMLREISSQYFGEGIAIWEDKIYQLTWRSRIGFVYARDDFDPLSTFSYETEGWGLTSDGSELIMSDGTSIIRFRDPESLEVTRQIGVNDAGNPVFLLNELEYIDGDIFANVWYADLIARVASESGDLAGWIDLGELCDGQPNGVLNGIAYDEDGDRLFVTGKNWDAVYEIVLTF
jgi:glutamine cyclotransferase